MAASREQVVQSAEKYVARGKIEPAIREYRKLLAENPNDINTLNRLGDLYARIQRNDEAIDFFTQIAEQYTNQGFFVKAIAIYKKIIKLDPTRLEVYEQLAELYGKQGLINEARTQYQVLADYYQKHDNAASAIAIYQKMAQLEPENPTYHVKLAEIYHQQQLIEKAMGEYRVIAELMMQHGRPQEAAQVYERALDLDSQNLGFIEDAAIRLRDAGHVAGAAHLLVVAAERNPQARALASTLAAEAPPPPPPLVAPPAEPLESTAVRRARRPAPEPPPPPAPPAEEEIELELTFGGDEIERAMREAEAAVGGISGTVSPIAEAPGGDLELELDLDEVFDVELPEEDAEPASLVKPPADLLEAPRRPAWSREPEPAIEAQSETIELSLDEDAFALPELEVEPESLAAAPPAEAAPQAPETVSWPGVSGWVQLDELPDLEIAPEPAAVAPADEVAEPALAAAEVPAVHPEREEDLISEAEVLAKYGLEEKAVERLNDSLRLRPDSLPAYALLVQIHLDKGRHSLVVELANRMAAAAQQKRDRDPWLKVRKKLVGAGYQLDGDHVAAAPRVSRIAAPADQVDALLEGLVDKAPPTPRRRRTGPMPAAPPEPAPPAAPPPPQMPPPSGKPIFNPLQIADLIENEGEDQEWLPEIVPDTAAPIAAAPAGSPAARLDDSGELSWLDEADRSREGQEAEAEGLFQEEDDFFDLAGELVEELSKEEVFQRDGGTVQAEQTLEEIVEGFKKGVAEHLSPTDYDTHFNLGIAYREMGLLDEAIGEFQLAAKDSSHLVLCCSMLGLCFLDKGLPELAIKWYRRALEAPGISEEDSLGMLYDLGNVYLQMGDPATAYKTFVELYGINTNYRDVVAKLEELGRPH